MLELAILGLLKEQELHGYELKKRLSETLGLASGVSFGSLYPALGRLEKAGAVRAVEVRSGASIPLTGSLGGELAAFRARSAAVRGSRGKKVYGLTPRGDELFEELLAAESRASDDDRLFTLRLAFARYLPPAARLGMLERRRSQLDDRMVRLATRLRAGRERLDAYAHSLIEHDRESTAHDLGWIDRLIAAERAGTTPTPTAGPLGGAPTAEPSPPPSRGPAAAPVARRPAVAPPTAPRPPSGGSRPSPSGPAPGRTAPRSPAPGMSPAAFQEEVPT